MPFGEVAEEHGTPDWDALIAALTAWREALRRSLAEERGADLTAVGTIAEHFRFDPWAVLVSTIISLRTKDAVTFEASKRLLTAAPNPTALLSLSQEEIEKHIYPCGFYRTKAANLSAIAGILIERFGGSVPQDMDTLLALPGVGRKTANLVLTEAFNLPGLCVDTHVHRISNRLGIAATKTPEETESALRVILPPQYWKPINPLLVLYGQQICRPISPHCRDCVIREHCKSAPS
ncbi:endonuclease III domain-containing protein [Breznakiellaceae bacterium SP9]